MLYPINIAKKPSEFDAFALGGPSLVAKEVLEGGANTAVPDAVKAGFNKYIHGGWEMIYNPTTKEVWHLQPIK